jgi:S-adenosylmethionine:tRNA ribosyltransferase-isomerase
LVIFNDTKVIEARILFQKSTGGVVEIFCLEPHEQYADITTGMMQKSKVLWQCMIGGASKWKHGQVLEKKIRTQNKEIFLFAKYVEKRSDSFVIEFFWSDDSMSFAEVLHNAGAIPLPPYIKREVEVSDAERYQTIYAHHQGSVASPTAGLHFTDDLMKRLQTKNIRSEFITLHVGAGTFKPVKSKTLEEHEMHSEFISISKRAIENILNNLPGDIIAVGTTSLRTIESLYWLGLKIKAGERDNLMISQWEPYELRHDSITVAKALEIVLGHMHKTNRNDLGVKTQIIIAPPYKTRIATALITNFHQPQSTLLLLVAALVGTDWKKIYAYALENDFRFLSYGDGCLLWINQAGTGEMTG